MEDLGKNLEKLIKAGIGAVSEGFGLTQDMVDKLAVKGKPLYNQACDTVSQTADRIRRSVEKTFDGKQSVDDIKHALAQLCRGQLKEIADYLKELIEVAEDETAPGDKAVSEDACEECAEEPCDKECEERQPGEEEEHVKTKDSHPEDDIFGNG